MIRVTLLDVFFETVDTESFTKVSNYDYWSIDNEGNYLFNRSKLDNLMLDESIEIDLILCIDYIYEKHFYSKSFFVPYEELEPLSKIDIEIKGKISFNNGQKYPLVCVRGMCHKPCEAKKELRPYCFHELPCTNKRPDWNCWTAKHPDFGCFLFDVVDFVTYCPHTDTLIVMFEYTPIYCEPELDFEHVLSAVLVKDTKITFITDSNEIKKLYKEYNTKYPTEDREIEEAISRPEADFYFKF